MRSSLLLLLGLASCAPTSVQPDTDVLAKEIAGRAQGATSSCISTFGGQNLRVVNPATVAYGQGKTIYINHLRSACPALSQFNTIIVEMQGSQYCSGDHVRGLEPGAIIPGPTCFLGNWTAYTKP